MKYIFVAGAPGSKWSSVVKNIYYSKDIDHSDFKEDRTYTGNSESANPNHLGAYFDPGMEFGTEFDHIESYSKSDCEAMFDEPFSGKGIRIIKSHVLSNKIDFLQSMWPDCPVVLVHRRDDSCLGWWLMAGGFNITYPNYRPYYKDVPTITKHIQSQNRAIVDAMENKPGIFSYDNRATCLNLFIQYPPEEYRQNYSHDDIRVKVLNFKKEIT